MSESHQHDLEQWRIAASQLREEFNLSEDAVAEIQRVFQRALIRQYWQPIYDRAMERTRQSEQVWATIIGIHRATAYRWRGDLSGEAGIAAKEPQLHHVVKSLAAFDLDGSIIPRGISATIAAYAETFDFVSHEILWNDVSTAAITTEEILYLHLAIRCPLWCKAALSSDGDLQHRAAAGLTRRVGRHVAKPTVSNFIGIQAILKSRFEPWAILETVILYEWIQS